MAPPKAERTPFSIDSIALRGTSGQKKYGPEQRNAARSSTSGRMKCLRSMIAIATRKGTVAINDKDR